MISPHTEKATGLGSETESEGGVTFVWFDRPVLVKQRWNLVLRHLPKMAMNGNHDP